MGVGVVAVAAHCGDFHCWVANPPLRSRLMAGRAKLTTVLSRKAIVETRIDTTNTLAVGAPSHNLTP
jgi:hypothetical protein